MTLLNWLGVALMALPIIGFLAVVAVDKGWWVLLFVVLGTTAVMALVFFGAYLASLPA